MENTASSSGWTDIALGAVHNLIDWTSAILPHPHMVCHCWSVQWSVSDQWPATS